MRYIRHRIFLWGIITYPYQLRNANTIKSKQVTKKTYFSPRSRQDKVRPQFAFIKKCASGFQQSRKASTAMGMSRGAYCNVQEHSSLSTKINRLMHGTITYKFLRNKEKDNKKIHVTIQFSLSNNLLHQDRYQMTKNITKPYKIGYERNMS